MGELTLDGRDSNESVLQPKTTAANSEWKHTHKYTVSTADLKYYNTIPFYFKHHVCLTYTRDAKSTT